MTTISFVCMGCAKTFTVSADKAGQKGTCPQCGGPIEVPKPKVKNDQPEDDFWSELPSPDDPPPKPEQPASPAPNPYAPPAPGGYGGQPAGSASPAAGEGCCPSCGSGDYRKVWFTWWGGLLGPWLLNHVVCNSCGTSFNSKTGKSNNTAIAIYLAVIFFGGPVLGLLVTILCCGAGAIFSLGAS